MNIKRFISTLIIILGLFVAVIAGIYVSSVMTFGENIITESQEADPVTGDRVNILVMGLDSDGDRSDVMMLLMINKQSNSLTMMSIPRDTKVSYRNSIIRINESHHYGGTDGAIKAVKDLTGQPVHYFASMTFEGFREIIDALGGVEYTLIRDYDYDDPAQNLSIHLKAGKQILDGKAAEGFVRFRNDYLMGDIDRVAVQQEFFRELVKQKLTAKYLFQLPSIANEVSKHIKTNMSVSTAVSYLPFLKNLKAESVTTVTLPGYTIDYSPYWHVNPAELKALLEAVDAGTVSATAPPTPTPRKSQIKITE